MLIFILIVCMIDYPLKYKNTQNKTNIQPTIYTILHCNYIYVGRIYDVMSYISYTIYSHIFPIPYTTSHYIILYLDYDYLYIYDILYYILYPHYTTLPP